MGRGGYTTAGRRKKKQTYEKLARQAVTRQLSSACRAKNFTRLLNSGRTQQNHAVSIGAT